MAERLSVFEFPDVRTVVLSYPEFTRQLLVMTPAALETRVRNAIRELDGIQPMLRIPVASANGQNARSKLEAQQHLLAELTDIPLSAMHISDDLSGLGDHDHGALILWVEATPDNINLIKNMVDIIRFIEEP